jgi:hypothetical protein
MTSKIELLTALASAPVNVTLGIPERLGDRCYGVELVGKRLAIIEPGELPAILSHLPDGPLRRQLKDVCR